MSALEFKAGQVMIEIAVDFDDPIDFGCLRSGANASRHREHRHGNQQRTERLSQPQITNPAMQYTAGSPTMFGLGPN